MGTDKWRAPVILWGEIAKEARWHSEESVQGAPEAISHEVREFIKRQMGNLLDELINVRNNEEALYARYTKTLGELTDQYRAMSAAGEGVALIAQARATDKRDGATARKDLTAGDHAVLDLLDTESIEDLVWWGSIIAGAIDDKLEEQVSPSKTMGQVPGIRFQAGNIDSGSVSIPEPQPEPVYEAPWEGDKGIEAPGV